MNELEDLKLKALLQEIKLDKPSPNFSARVMKKVFAENIAIEKIKSERILGKGFWIITVLFIALLVIISITSGTGLEVDSQLNSLIPEVNSGVSSSYQSILRGIGSVPLSISGILLASSLLLFIERFVTANTRIFS